jgi:tRNA A-37 threonylcarbamoyl transferase component Bud32
MGKPTGSAGPLIAPRRSLHSSTETVTGSPSATAYPAELGEFTLLGVLGQGGSATVYDARWGHRSIALKVVRSELADGERRRFLDEARLLMEMAHPGVVKVLSAGTLPDGRPYLAMEQLPGVTLGERLRDGPLPLPRATALFAQLCDAVAAMHRAGLVHRDLKPENVMLVEGGGEWHAVLLDFGIAKAMTDGAASLTETGQVRGTPAYMAPERFFGQPASIATDVYELAVTYYAMVAGQLPWVDSVDPDVRLNPTRLAEVAEVPPALDEEIARALSTRAAKRPPDVAALRDRVVAAAAADMGAALRITARDNPSAATFGLAPPPRTTGGKTGPTPWREPGGAATTGEAAAGERGRTTAPTRRRRRWPLVAALGGVAAAGTLAAIVWTQRSDAPAAAAQLRADPWAGGVEVDAGVAAVEPRLTAAVLTPARRDALRGKLSTALLHHSPDATVAVGVSLAELRAEPDLSKLTSTDSMLFGALRAMLLGACALPIGAEADWLTLALVERPEADVRDYELIVSGPWSRAEVEACLATGRPGAPSQVGGPGLDGTPLTSIPTDGDPVLVPWLDDRTFLVSTRVLDVAAAAARVRPRIANPSALDQIGTRIDRHATGWMVGAAAAVTDVIENRELAHPFTLRLTLGDDGVAGLLSLYPPDRARADRAQVAARGLLGELQKNPLLVQAFPELAVERDGDTVRLRGRLPARFTPVVAAQLVAALP